MDSPAAGRWRFLVTPRWAGWHLFAVLAIWGMAEMFDWQLHRALAGNGLSWAYTFEWPLFAGFGVVFWIKTVRDEYRIRNGIAPAVTTGDSPLPVNVGVQQQAFDDEPEDEELAAYNAYLTRLNKQDQGPGGTG